MTPSINRKKIRDRKFFLYFVEMPLGCPLLTDTFGIFTSRLADGGLGEEVVLEGPALDPGSCQASS
jgi:hypothetical protein